jgi:hypothetical protein
MKHIHTFESFLNEAKFYDKYRDEDILDAVLKTRKVKVDKDATYTDKIALLFAHHGVEEAPNHYSTDIFRLDSYQSWELPAELKADLDQIGITIK